MTDEENIRLQTINKYKELNEQLRDFLKNVLLFEKSSSSSSNEQTNSNNLNDTGGISLLSIKNDLLFQYIMNLVTVMYRRSRPDQSLTSASTRSIILRLCEIRTCIEKLRPIEQKLQYQIDKLLRNNIDQQLNYRANMENFDTDMNDKNENDEDEDQEEKQEKDKSKIYRPPKLVPVEYNEDYDDKDNKGTTNKRLEHLKRRAYHSDILEDYKNKYSDAPEEIYNTERSRLLQKNRAYKEKIAYEEEYLKRLPQTKQERLQIERSMTNNGNDMLDHLHDADVLFDDNFNGSTKKKKGKMSRRTKKRVEKKKSKSTKRLKSRQ